MTLANHPNAVNLSVMRGVRFDMGFALKQKETGAAVDLTGKTAKLKVYKIVSGVETAVLDITGTIPVPASGSGAFAITTAQTTGLTMGEEHWYRATIENGSEVEYLMGYGHVNLKDANP